MAKLAVRLVCTASFFVLSGCSVLRSVSVNDARVALCDAIGEERQRAEAQRLGMSPAEWFALWKATCLIRMQEAEGEAVGAIGGIR